MSHVKINKVNTNRILIFLPQTQLITGENGRCLHGLWSVSCASSNRKTLVCIMFHIWRLLIHYVDDWCKDALCVTNCHHIHSKRERKLPFRSAVPIKPSKNYFASFVMFACLSTCMKSGNVFSDINGNQFVVIIKVRNTGLYLAQNCPECPEIRIICHRITEDPL